MASAPFPPQHPPSWPQHHRLIPRRPQQPQQQPPTPPGRPPTTTTTARSLPSSTAVPPLADPAVRAELAIHGYAMLAVFTFLFPTMAWLMRYGSGRHRKSPSARPISPRNSTRRQQRGLSPGVAMFLHAGSLAISSIVTALAACLVLMNGIPCPSALHRIIGPTIVVALIGQVMFGVVTFLKTGRHQQHQRVQSRGEPSPIVEWIRVAHNIVGPLIMFFGFIQVPLGINMLYPFFQTPLAPMYLIYYVAVVWWSGVVVVSERRGIRNKKWSANLDAGGQGAGVDSAYDGGEVPGGIELVSGESSSSKLLVPSSGPVPSSSTSSSSMPARRPYHDHAPAAASSSSLAHPVHASSLVSPLTSASATTLSAPHHRPPHVPPAHNPSHAAKVISHALSLASQQNLPRLTWSDLDTYVTQRGKLWVIGPGGLVLDVSSWISTHPGGHKVLIDALGCNVSVDFFNLSNFDKQRFRAYPSKPKPRADDYGTGGSFRPATTDWPCTSTSGICSEIDPETCSPSVAIVQHRVTADDWKHVLVARQTNVHSKSAIAKLAGMAVALVPEVTLGTFNKLEYRRYAMTSKTVLGGSPSSVKLGRKMQRATTVQFTFTLLYPNETYLEEPTFFLPGHVIQLRLRLSPSSSSSSLSASHINQPPFWVTRYFTPLSGNMTHFSIAVKLQPGGLMSTLLASLEPAHHRQIHIRGPFGSPLMNPARPLPMDSGTFDHLVVLTAGSGVVAAVQLVAWYFTQTYFDLRVRPGYRPPSAARNGGGGSTTGKDLDVADGDKVLIRYPMTGGWVWGTNVRTGVDGYIALHALVPWIGTTPKVTVCVGERGGVDRIVGRDVLESAAGAYPAQVRVEYFISQMQDAGHGSDRADDSDSNVTPGRMTRDAVKHVLLSSGFLAALDTGRRACKIIICGPEGFVGACYEWVTELVDDQHVWVLPPHTYFHVPSSSTAAATQGTLSREVDARFAQVMSPSPPAALIPPRAPLAVGPGPVTLARNTSNRQVSFSPYTSPPLSSAGSPNNTSASASSIMVVGADGTRRMSSLAGLAMRRDRGSNMPEWLCVPSPVAAAGTLSSGSLHREREREREGRQQGGATSARFVGGTGGR
ncbi:hypothetical protein BCR44DRAFT_37599 [Catenaria anguillulae PL171]|uniref:Cytochrome b5 heme-binding domain-containing protein n=1 Tax=Catenaria anguillulae PL171 TaxID=765915 RepID=A0A1Y2HZD0_9FUNG|nr:hypothetical protein BCR44DRAFT_37599 [Catenaria anguillulae PL171]